MNREGSLRSQLDAILAESVPSETLNAQQREVLCEQLYMLLESAKLDALGEFAAGAGHEINNPVATISGRVQLLLNAETDPNRRQALEVIGGQALRIRDMIGDVMLFARPPVPKCESISLDGCINEAYRSLEPLARQKQVSFVKVMPADVSVFADYTQMLVVFSNLFRNAIEAADRPGVEIRLTMSSDSSDKENSIIITVADNGPGLSVLEASHLFDPFFSGRQAGRGLGFGLSKAWRILQTHGGQLRFTGQAGHRGCCLELQIPCSRK